MAWGNGLSRRTSTPYQSKWRVGTARSDATCRVCGTALPKGTQHAINDNYVAHLCRDCYPKYVQLRFRDKRYPMADVPPAGEGFCVLGADHSTPSICSICRQYVCSVHLSAHYLTDHPEKK